MRQAAEGTRAPLAMSRGNGDGSGSFRSVDSCRGRASLAASGVARVHGVQRRRHHRKALRRARVGDGQRVRRVRLPMQRRFDLRRRARLLRQQLQHVRQLRSELHRHRRCLPCFLLPGRTVRRLLRGVLRFVWRLHYDLLQPGRRRLQPRRSHRVRPGSYLLPDLWRGPFRRGLSGFVQLLMPCP